MAKKNKPSKKHRLKYAAPTTTVVGAGVTPAPAAPAAPKAAAVSARPAATVPGRDFSFVSGDLRRLAVFAASLIALELVLWYLMGHTGLGQSVYNLISV